MKNKPCRHVEMTSSPISGQSGSIYLNSPVDTNHQEDTDAENEIIIIKEHINNNTRFLRCRLGDKASRASWTPYKYPPYSFSLFFSFFSSFPYIFQ
jgi:hypothetical protein